MPGIRDRNLRSGDLHEELGLFLLRAVALVAPVPRQEDVGVDAFATLVRLEGSRRLLPDVSFLVQLKAASLSVVKYVGPDEVAWLTNLEIPLFIGRVDLSRASITLFSTQRVHQILLEGPHEEIHLLLDPADETAPTSGVRRANIGPPVHTWSVTDVGQPDFLTRTYSVLRPHVESLRRNRSLRDIGYQRMLRWETGQPPVDNGITMMSHPQDDISVALKAMTPFVHKLLDQITQEQRYRDFPTLLALVQMMRAWGVDPDPDGIMLRMTAIMAGGPEISDEEAIRWRHAANFNHLDLSRLPLKDESLRAIPDDVTKLALLDVPITDAGLRHLLRLTELTRMNLAGTLITDEGLLSLASLKKLRWLSVERTKVTAEGVSRLKAINPDLEVVL